MEDEKISKSLYRGYTQPCPHRSLGGHGIPYHYNYDALLHKSDKSSYDDMLIRQYGDDPDDTLTFYLWNAPLSIFDKIGKAKYDIELTDGELIEADPEKLIDEINKYPQALPLYTAFFPAEGVTVIKQPDDKTITYKGKEVVISKVDSSGYVDFGDDKPELEVGKVYRFKVKSDGKDTGKTLRAAYIDGRYRVIMEDLMNVL